MSGSPAGRMPESRLRGRLDGHQETRTCVSGFRDSAGVRVGVGSFLQNLQIA